MTLSGTAFLALWNERSPAREDYDTWHTREHVPERLTVPGILAGQRYASGEGPLPSYFTLYALRDLQVLEGDPYRSMLESPSPWSLSMRPAISDWYRRGCETVLSLGGGVGGCLSTVLLSGRPDEGAARAQFAAIADLPAFSGLHLGRVEEVPPLPFADGPPSSLPEADAILLLEGFDWDATRAALCQVDLLIEAAGYTALLDWTCYRLSYAMDASDRESLFALDASRLSRRTLGCTGGAG